MGQKNAIKWSLKSDLSRSTLCLMPSNPIVAIENTDVTLLFFGISWVAHIF